MTHNEILALMDAKTRAEFWQRLEFAQTKQEADQIDKEFTESLQRLMIAAGHTPSIMEHPTAFHHSIPAMKIEKTKDG
jgi:hypothetical protein